MTPLSELCAKMNDLEKVSVEGCVIDTLRHLRRLRSLLDSVKMEEECKSTRKLFVTELLSKQC